MRVTRKIGEMLDALAEWLGLKPAPVPVPVHVRPPPHRGRKG